LDSSWIYDFSEIGNDLSCIWFAHGRNVTFTDIAVDEI
jgi:hypothetical protein